MATKTEVDLEVECREANVITDRETVSMRPVGNTMLTVGLEGVDIGELIDAIGADEILNAIGEDECAAHFGLEKPE